MSKTYVLLRVLGELWVK